MSKRSGSEIEPLATPARFGFHHESCPFKTNLWNLPDRQFSRRSPSSPETSIDLSLYCKT